jgi:hypothetical protein
MANTLRHSPPCPHFRSSSTGGGHIARRQGGIPACFRDAATPVLHIRQLHWKLHDSKVELRGGNQVLISWDLHNWLFPSCETSMPQPRCCNPGSYRVRFKLSSDEHDSTEPNEELHDKAGRGGDDGWACYVGSWARGDWSRSSSNGEQ